MSLTRYRVRWFVVLYLASVAALALCTLVIKMFLRYLT
jgi:hypothetical protein